MKLCTVFCAQMSYVTGKKGEEEEEEMPWSVHCSASMQPFFLIPSQIKVRAVLPRACQDLVMFLLQGEALT